MGKVGKRPRWVRTNVEWPVKKRIWCDWARGYNISQTVRNMELEGDSVCRDTVSSVREELRSIPAEGAAKLVGELPELRPLILGVRPDLKSYLEKHEGQSGDSARVLDMACQRHFDELTVLVEDWVTGIDNLPQVISDYVRLVWARWEDSQHEPTSDFEIADWPIRREFFKRRCGAAAEAEYDALQRSLQSHLADSSYTSLRTAWERLQRAVDESVNGIGRAIIERRLTSDEAMNRVRGEAVKLIDEEARRVLRDLTPLLLTRVFAGRCSLCPR